MTVIATRLSDEDRDRAHLYALLGTLFAAPPDREVLATLMPVDAGAPSAIVTAWNALCDAQGIGLERIRAEYDALFVGVGKPDVMLNGSYYLSGFLHERPLAQLRAELAELGLRRSDAATETEDHLSTVCAVMRLLIERGDPRQSGFFEKHLASWGDQALQAMLAHPNARFYARAAELMQALLALEKSAAAFDRQE